MDVLILAELTGSNVLTLEDSTLPAQDVVMGSTTRMQMTYYPGVSAPSTQIMGTQEEDIVLRGLWRDDLMGLTDGAWSLLQTARALQLGQRRCSLTWGGLTRYGYVKGFRPTVRRRSHITWELTFAVDSADDAPVLATPAVPLPSSLDLVIAMAALEGALDTVSAEVVAVNDILQAVA